MTLPLVCIYGTVFLLAFGMSFVGPLIPLLLQQLQATPATIGQIQTTFFLAFTAVSLLVGPAIDRLGS